MNEQVLAQPVADSTLHPLEQLAATNSDAEIWWDSSPLIFPSWRSETLGKAPAGKQAQTAEEAFNTRARTLEEQVVDLKEKIYRRME